jgi:hypothetical protein
MLTRKLHQAQVETEKLAEYLKKRDWEKTDQLTRILEKANRQIDTLAKYAIFEVIYKLENSFLGEAEAWAKGESANLIGEKIEITTDEQCKVGQDAGRIKKTVEVLKAL